MSLRGSLDLPSAQEARDYPGEMLSPSSPPVVLALATLTLLSAQDPATDSTLPRVESVDSGCTTLLTSVHVDAWGRAVAVGGDEENEGGVLLRTRVQEAPLVGSRDRWSRTAVPARHRLYSARFATPSHGFACGLGGTLLKTVDAGSTWTLERPVGDGAFLVGLAFVDARTGLLVGAQEGGPVLLRTTDAGTTWVAIEDIEAAPGSGLRSVAFASSSVGYACGTSGLVLVTEDAGRTWVARPSDQEVWLKSISTHGPDQAWIAGGQGVLIETVDRGVTWKALPFPTKDKLNAVLLLGSKEALVGTMQGGLWWTADRGRSWERIHSGPRAIAALAIASDETVLACGSGGLMLQVRR